MLEHKRISPFIALCGAVALMVSAPAFAQTAPANGTPAAAAAAAPAAAAASASDDAETAKVGGKHAGKLNPVSMFVDAHPVVKTVMSGLILASVVSWAILLMKLLDFGGLNRKSARFLEEFRTARSIADISRIASSEEFQGNPLADMAAAAAGEIETSRQAGLQVSGAHKDSTLSRSAQAVSAVQGMLAQRLSGGMQFLASVGSSGPFIGLFGTVFGIMNSFIGIANTNTTNLAVVAPGIAEALLATGIGLFAAIPAVIFYNYFQTQIAGYGSRTEGFIAELTNAISRQLDKGA